MTFHYTGYSLALLITAIIALLLAGYSWPRRAVPGGIFFFLTMLAVVEWSLSSALEFAAIEIPVKVFWAQMSYLGTTTITPFWVLFALYYGQRPGWFTNRRIGSLFIFPIIIIVLTFTNQFHRLVWPSITPISSVPGAPLIYAHGAAAYANMIYAYVLSVVGTAIMVRIVLRSTTLVRLQAGTILAAVFVPWVSNLIYFLANPFPGLDLTPFAFTITGLLVAFSIFGFRLLDIMPVAHEALFASMSSGVLVLDAKKRIIDLNPAAQRFFSIPSRIVGQPADSVLSAYPDLLANLQSTSEVEAEIVLGKKPVTAWLDMRMTPLFNRRKQFSGQLIVLQDITVRKQAEEQLVEANHLKTQLLANVSHDLRTPLNAIIGFTEMLEAGVYGPINAEQYEATDEIVDSANQLLAFVDNLVGAAQIETGKIVIRVKPFNLEEMIKPILATMSLLARRKKVILEYKIQEELPKVIRGDAYWLRQIVFNLVNNAVKFTDQGAVMVQFLQVDAAHWAIQVADTGIGIPAEAQEQIFQAFRQLDDSTTRRYSGSGLGLTIAKQLSDLMAGQITLKSTVGKGSIFTVTLPLITAEEKSA
jgi:signal transduction histidine kinase